MKKSTILLLSVAILAACLSACGWKPEVSAVQITAPWAALNLPVKENAVVWKSDPNEFRAVHKEDKKTITRKYTEVLKSQGWKLDKFDESGDRWVIDMSKGSEQLHLEFYDFSNTGVLIERRY